MNRPDPDEFYVGYLPKAPAGLARWLRPRVWLLVCLPLPLALALALAQRPFGPSVFEFQQIRAFEGVVLETPYPMLRVTRPQGGSAVDHSLYYLVNFGKFGAQAAVAGLAGKRVRLEGELIYRDDQTMIQVKEGSIQVLGDGLEDAAGDLGRVTLVGEIVDSKCFLGVMNPGNLKPHKACAIACIRGGIPPVLLVRDGEGHAYYFLLTSTTGKSLGAAILSKVAEPVRVTGTLAALDNIYWIRTEPGAIERLP